MKIADYDKVDAPRRNKKPDFFIVGAAKSGTTAMYTYLKQHPEIFMSKVKEPRYFGKDLWDRFPHFNLFPRPTEQEYLSYFSGVKNEKRIGEATPNYLTSQTAAREIKEFNPSAQIIIMLRNPVDVLYSAHSQALYDGTENIYDFAKAIRTGQEERRRLAGEPNRPFVDKYYYRELVKFSEQVKRYFDVFGRDNVYVIIFDDFKTNTRDVYKKTLRFLGVDTKFEPEFKVINPNKVVRSKVLRDFYRTPPSTIQKLGKFFVPKILRLEILKELKRLNTKYVPRPPMDPEIRHQLQEEFKTEVEKLSELLGRDLTYWCSD